MPAIKASAYAKLLVTGMPYPLRSKAPIIPFSPPGLRQTDVSRRDGFGGSFKFRGFVGMRLRNLGLP